MELMGQLASTTLSGSLLLIAATTGLTVVMSEVGINAAETSATEPKQAMFRTQAEAELVALVVAVVFISVVTQLDLALLVVPLFVMAMVCLMAAALLFQREVQLATAQVRRRF